MKPKPSIRSRLIWSLLLIIGFAFICVFVVFNVALQQYINTSTSQALDDAANMLLHRDHQLPPDRMPRTISDRGLNDPRVFDQTDWQQIAEGTDEEHTTDDTNWEDAAKAFDWDKIVDQRQPSPIGAQVHATLYDWNTHTGSARGDSDTVQEIAESIDPEDALDDACRVQVDDKTYLVKTLRSNTDSYFLLYVDITQFETLVHNINIMLVIILVVTGAVAVFVALWLAYSIAKPIEQISAFATQLGNNEFAPCHLNFEDKEPSELLKVMNVTAEKLEKYDKDQKTFFQNVSHELKTPLMTIRCNAEGIVCNVMNPEASGEIIIEQTDRLVAMIDELLFISKLDQITESDVEEDCDLREILSNCAESQRSNAQKRNINITYDFDEEPVTLRVAETNISRVFSNLISNAIRYATSEVSLVCRAEKDDDIVRVWNDGPPIDEEDMPHIFERFFKGPEGQSGIGLSIVHSIVDKMGGSVGVVSDDGGTCFTIRFPKSEVTQS